MKTIISTILICAGTVFLHSCREYESEEPIKLERFNMKTTKAEISKNNDSIQEATSQNNIDPDQLVEDPPIRHGGQWKFNY